MPEIPDRSSVAPRKVVTPCVDGGDELWQKYSLDRKQNTIDKSTIWAALPIEFPSAQAHNPHPMDATSPTATVYPVAVIMELTALTGNRWQTTQWEARGVLPDTAPPGSTEEVTVRNDKLTQIVFAGHQIRLHRDEAEGYLLNITSPQPKVFVLWRMEDEVARPQRVTVSYHEGARWMDSDERVYGVPLPAELVPWIREVAVRHYTPDVKKAKRYASSKDKGRMGRFE